MSDKTRVDSASRADFRPFQIAAVHYVLTLIFLRYIGAFVFSAGLGPPSTEGDGLVLLLIVVGLVLEGPLILLCLLISLTKVEMSFRLFYILALPSSLIYGFLITFLLPGRPVKYNGSSESQNIGKIALVIVLSLSAILIFVEFIRQWIDQ